MLDLAGKIHELYRAKDFSFLVLILSFVLLPLSINLSSLALVVAIVLKILQAFFHKESAYPSKALLISSAIGLGLVFYIFIRSLFLEDFTLVLRSLEENTKYVLFFLAPLLIRKDDSNKLLIVGFFWGVIGSVVFAFSYAIITGVKFDREVFLHLFGIHHTYISMFMVFLLNPILGREGNTFPLVGKITVAMVFFYTIYNLDSKVSMAVFIVILIVHLIWYLNKKNFFIYFLLFLVALFVFIRFNNKSGVDYRIALDYRVEVWEASIAQIKENVFFGSLEKDEKQLLNYQHFLSGKYYFLDRDINSHNQYLSVLLKFGVFGFLFLLSYAIFFLFHLRKNFPSIKSREAFGFVMIITLICCIENIFDRHHGIVFFTTFYNYYIVLFTNESI
ncbi:MAG: O-antigen ligase family protein [Bacteroidota bacterium]